MNSIRILPPELVSKIAAGEVIERPASIVKELVENSIDAGAKTINVWLEDGGHKLIRVVDDGHGMPPEDLALAFHSHATSKLSSAEDLFNIRTLGFRGEALASIGAVSMTRIISRPGNCAIGAEVEVIRGKISEVREKGAPPGTTVEVRNLFHNVPARKKFLKSSSHELAAAHDMLVRLAVPFHTISFQLFNGQERLLCAPAVPTVVERIGTLFGLDVARSLMRGRQDGQFMSAEVYVAPPDQARSSARMLMFFLNNRHIRDRTLYHAVIQAFWPCLEKGKYPVCFVLITCVPSEVDVNVHPTKAEVRFRKPRDAYDTVHDAVKKTLEAADLSRKIIGVTTEFKKTPPEAYEGAVRPGFHDTTFPPQTMRTPPDQRQRIREKLFDLFKPFIEPATEQRTSSQTLDLPMHESPASSQPSAQERTAAIHTPADIPSYFQAHGSYIVTETPDGIAVIDQHALHERILYNEIKLSFEMGNIERQTLLIPDVISLTFQEYTLLNDLRCHLERLGFSVEDFGPNTVRVTAVPAYFRGASCQDFLQGIIEDYRQFERKESWHEIVNALVQRLACTAAVKAGMRLTPAEIEELLSKAFQQVNFSTCPHGRPTVIKLTLSELEKHFGRT